MCQGQVLVAECTFGLASINRARPDVAQPDALQGSWDRVLQV